jgi:hypothetical protein
VAADVWGGVAAGGALVLDPRRRCLLPESLVLLFNTPAGWSGERPAGATNRQG